MEFDCFKVTSNSDGRITPLLFSKLMSAYLYYGEHAGHENGEVRNGVGGESACNDTK